VGEQIGLVEEQIGGAKIDWGGRDGSDRGRREHIEAEESKSMPRRSRSAEENKSLKEPSWAVEYQTKAEVNQTETEQISLK
jgi:hypothetical protein